MTSASTRTGASLALFTQQSHCPHHNKTPHTASHLSVDEKQRVRAGMIRRSNSSRDRQLLN